MIKEIFAEDYEELKKFLRGDIGRNYFTLLGMESKKLPYTSIYGQYYDDDLSAVLFLRKTGTLQFFSQGAFDLEAFVELIKKLDYKSMIGPRSLCHVFYEKGLFKSFKPGAYISRLSRQEEISSGDLDSRIRPIVLEDLEEVVEVYRECFNSFAPKEVMEEKLLTKRGRGLCLVEEGRILSLAQSDFETDRDALIVGVATRPTNRNQGLASLCLEALVSELSSEGKDLYLQYDNLEAGRIYERLGFKVLDQVGHYIR